MRKVKTSKKNLNLGCGNRILPDSFNVDILSLPGVDLNWDLEEMPYPFEDEQFEKVICGDILEHLENPYKVVEEIHRILKPKGILWIRGPHYKYPKTGLWDLTHKHIFTDESFDIFVPGTEREKMKGWYTKVKFKMLKKEIVNKGIEFTMQKISKKK